MKHKYVPKKNVDKKIINLNFFEQNSLGLAHIKVIVIFLL